MRPRAMHCPPTPPRTTRRPSVHQVMRRPKRGRTLSATGPPKHTQPHHPGDGSLATLSERCMVARDVFYVDSIDPLERRHSKSDPDEHESQYHLDGTGRCTVLRGGG